MNYMEKKYGERASCGDKGNLQNMRNEVVRLEALLEKQKEKTAGSSNDAHEDRGSEDQSEQSVSAHYEFWNLLTNQILFYCFRKKEIS